MDAVDCAAKEDAMPRPRRERPEARRQTKEERLQVRMTPDLKRQLADVAQFRGLSMSDFVTLAISEAVTKANHERHVIEMSREESVWLAELLLNPPAPNERMVADVERYKHLVRP